METLSARFRTLRVSARATSILFGRHPLWAAAAGTALATAFAVGLIGHGVVIAVFLVPTAAWSIGGDRWRRPLAASGLAFAATLAALHVTARAALPPEAAVCARLSTFQVMLAGGWGIGLAALAVMLRGRRDGPPGVMMRCGALLALISAMVTVVATTFPDRLGERYVDSRPAVVTPLSSPRIGLAAKTPGDGQIITGSLPPLRLRPSFSQ